MSARLPKISVPIAARNAEDALQGAVQSILHQSLPAEEVLLILNGNDDQSEAIARARAQSDARLARLAYPADPQP